MFKPTTQDLTVPLPAVPTSPPRRLLPPRLQPYLRILGLLPPLGLARKPMILLPPKAPHLLRIHDRLFHATQIHPVHGAYHGAPQHDLTGQAHPEHDGAVRHAQNLERDPEHGEQEDDRGDVGLRGEACKEWGEVCLQGLEDAEGGG